MIATVLAHSEDHKQAASIGSRSRDSSYALGRLAHLRPEGETASDLQTEVSALLEESPMQWGIPSPQRPPPHIARSAEQWAKQEALSDGPLLDIRYWGND